jgi:hypothetical protein
MKSWSIAVSILWGCFVFGQTAVQETVLFSDAGCHEKQKSMITVGGATSVVPSWRASSSSTASSQASPRHSYFSCMKTREISAHSAKHMGLIKKKAKKKQPTEGLAYPNHLISAFIENAQKAAPLRPSSMTDRRPKYLHTVILLI